MTKEEQKILINVEDDETRIAFINGSYLENLNIEQTHRTQKVGNIYCGKVVKVQPSFQAAFIDYGEARHGFLSLSDINFQVYKLSQSGRGRPTITHLLKPGQKVLVQVIKDEIAHKGASLTTNISLAGRFLVFMPDSERGGVSRKIEDEEQRTRLRHLLKGLGGEDASAIIRTVGVDRSLTELKRDFTVLRRTWNEIKSEHEDQSVPGLLYQEEDAIVRMIRDYYHENVSEVVIDEPVAFQHALEFFQTHMPREQKKLQLYLGEKSLFASYGIEEQIEVLHQHKVPLPSGGSIVIMQTEALVAIDVNSGRSAQERNIESTAYRTNMEAAEEISKQLRLRNLGGLIVVDFIDMDNSKNRLAVEQKMEEELAADKSKISLGSISKFGLMELSRQRISASLSLNSTVLTLANRILRKIHDSVIEQKVLQVHIRLPLKLATHLLNVKRQRLTQMELDYGVRISITPDLQLDAEEIPEMEVTIKEQDGEEQRTSVPISAADMRDEKPARKKGRKKKEAAKSDTKIIQTEIPDDTKIEEPVNETEEIDLKSSTKANDKKSDKDAKARKTSPDKNSDDTKKKADSDVPEKINKTKENIKKKTIEEKPAAKENSEGVLFMSVHEPLSKQDSKDIEKSEKDQSFEKNSKSETSMYSSVHLEDISNSENKIKKVSNETSLIENVAETNLYNSVHLSDEEKVKSKAPASKKPAAKRGKSEKTDIKADKKSVKKTQSKSTKKIAVTAEADPDKAKKQAKAVRTKEKPKASSGTKSKSTRSKVSAQKKEEQKSRKPVSTGKDGITETNTKQESKTQDKRKKSE
ncbi:MAG: Ribonuclease E [Deltaproteobacteria bacterium]|jgi:ribonuclease E|nr:Ribonuclease E [Deltaproteobacteria bacterium]